MRTRAAAPRPGRGGATPTPTPTPTPNPNPNQVLGEEVSHILPVARFGEPEPLIPCLLQWVNRCVQPPDRFASARAFHPNLTPTPNPNPDQARGPLLLARQEDGSDDGAAHIARRAGAALPLPLPLTNSSRTQARRGERSKRRSKPNPNPNPNPDPDPKQARRTQQEKEELQERWVASDAQRKVAMNAAALYLPPTTYHSLSP